MSAIRTQPNQRLRPGSGWWWLSALVTMVVAFQMNYIRIHLLTEFHHRGGYSVPIAGHCHDQSGEHGHDHAPHQPHSTDDHSLQLAGKRSCLLQSLELLLPDQDLPLVPLAPATTFVTDAEVPTGTHPPDPLQPRAPPII